MARRRTRLSEADSERLRAEAWRSIQAQLAAATGLVDAQRVLITAPPESHLGRRYYSNLGFFLQTFSPPAGANREEIALYIRLLERINAEGLVKEGRFVPLRQALIAAMDDGSPSRFM